MKELARELRDAGVRAAFGVPGSGPSLALLTALEEIGLPVEGTAHEAAAVLMACAFGRQAGGLACAVSIKGPGLANMVPGLLAARYEGWPVLTLAEAYAPGQTARMHKRLDHRATLSPFVKAHGALDGPPLQELVERAMAELPGPVHVDLVSGMHEASKREAAAPAPVDVDPMLSLIGKARRPLVVAGSLALRRAWASRLGELRVPVLTTAAAKGVVDEHAAFAAGIFTADGGSESPERLLLEECDLVVGLGLRTSEVLSVAALPAPLVLLDALREPPVAGWPTAATAFGASDAAFSQALDLLKDESWGEDLVRRATAGVRERLTRHAWLPGAAFAALETILPRDAVLVVDTGSFCTVAEHVYRARASAGFLASSNGRFMGVALPLALGAALQDPARPVVCCVGDGGLPPYVGEWRLAASRRLQILLILMSDGGYGSLASAPSARAGSPRLLEISSRSWAPALEAMGSPALRLCDRSALESETRRWLERGGPAFFELPFDPVDYRAMLEGIR